MAKAQFPSSLTPPGTSPAQHTCQGKAFTQEEQFAKFIVEPWAVMAGKEDNEGDKRKKELQKVQYQRTNFARNLLRWFPGKWADFLATTPCLSPFILSGTYVQGSANPPAWIAAMPSSSLLDFSISVGVPYWDHHGFFSITSKPLGLDSLDLWSYSHYSQHVQVGVCYLSAFLAKRRLKTIH